MMLEGFSLPNRGDWPARGALPPERVGVDLGHRSIWPNPSSGRVQFPHRESHTGVKSMPATVIPTVDTERLTLRGHRLKDFEESFAM